MLDARERLSSAPEAIFAFGPRPAEKRSFFAGLAMAAKASAIALPMALMSGMSAQLAIDAAERSAQKAAEWAAAEAKHVIQAAARTPTPGEWLAKKLKGSPEDTSNYEVARLIAEKDTFLSLATAVESVKTQVYYDPAGANIGMGYCITIRAIEYGPDRVKEDLAGAGMEEAKAEALAAGKAKAAKGASITLPGAVLLLEKTASDYREIARADVGEETFDNLPEHKQAVLSYLAYNAGELKGFKRLLRAVRSGDDPAAMREMAPWWRDSDGVMKENHRLRAWAQAAWMGPERLAKALSDPHEFEGKYAREESRGLLAKEAKRLALKAAAEASRGEPDGFGDRLASRRAALGDGSPAAKPKTASLS